MGSRLPDRLSYTQLGEFEHCPRRFWSRRVLGVRSVRFREPGQTDPLRFGTALHGALRLLGSGAQTLPDSQLLAIARFFELDREETERLRVAVKRYAESDVASTVSRAETMSRETPFVLPIGGLFKLTGSIDLYARSGESATIVDYKSGRTGEGADLAARYRLQSDCYALAALRDGRTAVHVEFVRPEVSDDAGRMQRVSFDYLAEDGVRIEGELTRRYGEMEASAFDPRPSGEECAFCDVPQALCSQGERRSG
jgi:RecB family exonuclease